MQVQRGLPLLVLILLGFLSYDIGRHVLVNQSVPTFFVENVPEVQVALEGDWEGAGVYQISDGMALGSVIKMAGLVVVPSLDSELAEYAPVVSGERYILQVVSNEVRGVSRGRMTAAQRIALGVPLHPDQMTIEDWAYLPGVGEHLATEIERDRQKNGEFVGLESLQRVRGIGEKRIKRWREFF